MSSVIFELIIPKQKYVKYAADRTNYTNVKICQICRQQKNHTNSQNWQKHDVTSLRGEGTFFPWLGHLLQKSNILVRT